MRVTTTALVACIGLACAGARPAQPTRPASLQFAADYRAVGSDAPPRRLYVGARHVRVQTVDSQGRSTYFVRDFGVDQTLLVDPAMRAVVRVDGVMGGEPPEQLSTGEDRNPCRSRGAPPQNCERLGASRIGEFEATEWKILEPTPEGEFLRVWVDDATGVIVRRVLADGSGVELLNVDVGTQADELFSVPEGFRETHGVATPMN